VMPCFPPPASPASHSSPTGHWTRRHHRSANSATTRPVLKHSLSSVSPNLPHDVNATVLSAFP
jgi:hypothetical protein